MPATTKTIGQIYNCKETRGDITVKKTFNIPVEQIFIEEGFNVKAKIYDETVDGLVKAYIAGDHVPDIVVEPQSLGMFKIIDGHHRFTAILKMIEMGYDYRRVTVQGFKGTKSQQVALMVTSSQGRNLNAVERAEAYARLDRFNVTRKEISEMFIVSLASVDYHLNVHNLPEEIKEYIIVGKIAADYALELCRKHELAKVIDIIEGVKTKKVTRSNTTAYRPAMGKSIVSLLAEVESREIENGDIVATFTPEQWEVAQKAINALTEEA